MNDLSAHPAPTGRSDATCTHNSVILNTLADLTNRENRLAYQRFANDFQNDLAGSRAVSAITWPTTSTATTCPTITRRSIPASASAWRSATPVTPQPAHLRAADGHRPPVARLPGPDGLSRTSSRAPTPGPRPWDRSQWHRELRLDPLAGPACRSTRRRTPSQFDVNPLALSAKRQPQPDRRGRQPAASPAEALAGSQTWWGFPTWRETLSPAWIDPT